MFVITDGPGALSEALLPYCLLLWVLMTRSHEREGPTRGKVLGDLIAVLWESRAEQPTSSETPCHTQHCDSMPHTAGRVLLAKTPDMDGVLALDMETDMRALRSGIFLPRK